MNWVPDKDPASPCGLRRAGPASSHLRRPKGTQGLRRGKQGQRGRGAKAQSDCRMSILSEVGLGRGKKYISICIYANIVL